MMVDWDNLRIVLAVRRAGSVAAAARALGVNYSTVNRRLAGYEAALGTKVFERTASGQLCTALGRQICDAAEQMEATLQAAERAVVGEDARVAGDLRVTMPGNLFHALLVADVAAFTRAHPDIRLNLSLTSELSDLARREADVALRFANNPPESLVGQRIANTAMGVYANPDYLAAHPDPATREWIGWRDASRRPPWVTRSSHPDAAIKHQVYNDWAQVRLAAQGWGLAMASCFLGDREPGVVRVPPGKATRGRDLWILTHQDLRQTGRVRAFMAFMRDVLRGYAPVLRGEERSRETPR